MRDSLAGHQSLVCKAAGGSPAAGYFSCAAKQSNQKKAAPVSRPFSGVTLRRLSWQGGCGTRPGEMHTTHLTAGLAQSSPTPPCQAELLGASHGEQRQAPQSCFYALSLSARGQGSIYHFPL